MLMKGAKSSSGSVVETEEYQTYSRLRHAQNIVNHNENNTNNTSNLDIQQAIEIRKSDNEDWSILVPVFNNQVHFKMYRLRRQ